LENSISKKTWKTEYKNMDNEHFPSSFEEGWLPSRHRRDRETGGLNGNKVIFHHLPPDGIVRGTPPVQEEKYSVY
jgi:hypothetical protein